MKIRQIIAASAIVLATLGVSAANAATTFDFSYTYANTTTNGDDTVTGSFTGTGSLTDITVDSVIGVKFNGKALTGNLNAFSYTQPGTDCPTCWKLGGAEVSSTLNDNNFLFIDSDSAADVNAHNYTNYFYIIPWPNSGYPEAAQYFNQAGNVGDGPGSSTQYVNYFNGTDGVFTVTAVPEPATWAMLLLGFFGIGVMVRGSRRKDAVALA